MSESDLPPELEMTALVGEVDFVTTADLREALAGSPATPEQADTAVAINEDAQRKALRASFLLVGALALLAIFPSRRLPAYVPDELSADDPATL